MKKSLSITVLEDRYSISRLAPDQPIPQQLLVSVDERKLFSILRTDRELSIVCPASVQVGAESTSENWAAMEVDGPLDFSEVGILARISNSLATQNISLFVLSSYDTDYVLVAEKDLESATIALRADGMSVR